MPPHSDSPRARHPSSLSSAPAEVGWCGPGLDQSRPPRNGTVDELVAELRGSDPLLVTGELDDDQAALIERLDGVSLPPLPLRTRHPGALAELAWRRWRAGSFDEAGAIEPVYLSR